ncbi:MAG: DUF1573 domain-containing protein [Bacteroidota bacterium]
MKKYLVLLYLLVCTMVAYAQPINKPTYNNTLEFAKELEEKGDLYNALEKYEAAFEESEDKSLSYPIGLLQYRLRDYKRSERAFKRLIRKEAEKYPDLRYYYGLSLKHNEKYEEAIKQLEQFISETDNEELKAFAEIELTGAEMGQELPPRLDVAVETLGRKVNSKSSEYSPTLDGNFLYYTSFNTDDVILVTPDLEDYQARIYRSERSNEGEWSKPKELGQKINRKGFHNSNVHIDRDRMYFTRAQVLGDVLQESKIMMSRKGDTNWQGAEEVVGINGEYIAKHPMTGELFGKRVLFFASDMDGGFGGFDLYYATLKDDGVYGDPVNLGPKINTVRDEETPFYRDGTLYFSSTGHPGIGGFDIFFTNWNGTIWSEPKNMGKGFNSSVDDLYFSVDADGYTGLLVSNREFDGKRSVKGKTCCNDMYAYQIAQITADVVAGTFTKEKKPLTEASITVVDLTTGERFSQTNKEGNVFNFSLSPDKSYRLVATHPKYYPDSTDLSTVGLKASKSYEERFYLNLLPPPEPEYETVTSETPIELNNILYAFDSDRILDQSEPDIQYLSELMEEYPDMRIELGSHTDARGEDAYNKNLSQRRAESARRALVRNGVARDRMEAKGYGESTPKTMSERLAAPYDFLNEGDVLTEAFIEQLETEDQRETAHQLNRRTEFRIISGPTSIKVSTKRLKKVETPKKENPNTTDNSRVQPRRTNSPNRRGGNGPTPPTILQESIKIHKLSSLYGKKKLENVPIMHFDERVVDFGQMKQGEKRSHTYTFTNMGDVPLEIDVLDYCECTEADWTRRTVQPGEQGKIDVVFDSTEKDASETIDVYIMLKQNDPENGLQIFETIQYRFELME